MHTFYKDKATLFEFKINVEGAELEDTFARVILENNNRKYLFEGTIKDGVCSIDLPALKEFKETSNSKLKVEVVADTSYFVPYTSEYELKESKKIVVEMISRTAEAKKPKVIVEAINTPVVKVENKKIEKKIIKETFEDKFIKLFNKNKSKLKSSKFSSLPSKEALDITRKLINKSVISESEGSQFELFIDTKIPKTKLKEIKKALGF